MEHHATAGVAVLFPFGCVRVNHILDRSDCPWAFFRLAVLGSLSGCESIYACLVRVGFAVDKRTCAG